VNIAILYGTRPEIIKLNLVIRRLQSIPNIKLFKVWTGQNYDTNLSDNFFQCFPHASPTHYLECCSTTAVQFVGSVIQKMDDFLAMHPVDAVLVFGDTNSCLGVYAARRRGIPIIHLEAGNRSFSRRVPEEVNRGIVDWLSDLNICVSESARQNLIREGYDPRFVINAGTPMREILDEYSLQINSSSILDQLGLATNSYILVSLHREEVVDDSNNLSKILNSILNIAKKNNKKVVLSLHPRTKERLGESILDEEIILMPPMNFFDYISSQKQAYVVISDSGTISEEAAIGCFPAVMMRLFHERIEAIDDGIITLGGVTEEHLELAIDTAILFKENTSSNNDYLRTNFSTSVVRSMIGYISSIHAKNKL